MTRVSVSTCWDVCFFLGCRQWIWIDRAEATIICVYFVLIIAARIALGAYTEHTTRGQSAL
jgi:hypothetical protein